MPLYETDAHRAAERIVANVYAGLLPDGLLMVERPPESGCDWIVVRATDKQIDKYIEIKCRPSNKQAAYKSYMLDLNKARACLNLAHTSPAVWILIYAWSDKIVGRKFDPIDRKDRFWWGAFLGGRTDRGDDMDVDPVVYFDACTFVKIGDTPDLTIEAHNVTQWDSKIRLCGSVSWRYEKLVDNKE